ncbi:phosphatidylinositol-3,5-bisphosphate 5-phosphatase [Irineochytrium annulatum]|nr:phosphatidylinositol-3,5-bisphosphate 5-phosphatase [Irineochytrium annulatum]
MDLLKMIENGNKATGGLSKVATCHGIVGFVKFLEGFYMLLVTKRSAVALIGGHYIYHIDDTLTINIATPSAKIGKAEEIRYAYVRRLNMLNKPVQVDLTKNFYFSYTYDITRSLQHNMTRQSDRDFDYEESFGYVANDVETEQIVHDANTTSLVHPRGRYGEKPSFTSFLQHRGSIPLYWSQESSQLAPKPPIELNIIDPFYSAAALHFDDMFRRYGAPIIVLNLIKSKEKTPRESILLDEFSQMIQYLNQFLRPDMQIKYIPWDMARASKSEAGDVVGILEDLAEEVLSTTGFFHSGPEPYINALRRASSTGNSSDVNRILGRRQNGVVRTNCIDCLDRTNAAQFVIGKCAFGHQLYALGVVAHHSIPFDSDAANLLNAMYHDHGDTIALQYGGSHLVNTMETYRKISPWTSHSRDMIESIRRYYNNSFTDAEKQEAINLFLGNFRICDALPNLWELTSDYYLHNRGPRMPVRLRSYKNWWTFDVSLRTVDGFKENLRIKVDDYALEYYRPRNLTQFDRLYAFNINPSTRGTKQEDGLELSPFNVRENPLQQQKQLMMYNLNIGGVKRWLTLSNKPKSSKETKDEKKDAGLEQKQTKENPAPWWTTSALASRLLEPQVPLGETREYKRYVSQFKPSSIVFDATNHSLSSAVTSTGDSHPDRELFQRYIQKTSSENSFAASNPLGGESEWIDSKDESLYVHYATQANKVSTYMGPVGRQDLPRYEAYSKWLQTGKFVNARKTK